MARRPSVSTSRRKVVISNGRLLTIAVTVPCFRPVGTTLMSAASSAFVTISGGLSTAMSMSLIGRSSTQSRTQPPTKRAAMPPPASASNNIRTGGSFIQAGVISLVVPSAVEGPCLDEKRHVVESRSLRYALRAPVGTTKGSWREQAAVALVLGEEHDDEADDGADEPGDGEPGQGQVLPFRQGAGDLALLLDLDAPRPQEE